MKKLIILGLLAASVLALPASANAHVLRNGSARPLAQRVCNAVNDVPADENPYICRRVGAARRRSAHRIDYPLSMFDPNDGEECIAVVRVSFRNRFSFRRVAREGATSCLADPFAGV